MGKEQIKLILPMKYDDALDLVWNTFLQTEAKSYSEVGIHLFFDSIHDKQYLSSLKMYGYYQEDRLLGVIATRKPGTHVALFFVDEKYQQQGIGKKLFHYMMEETKPSFVTVNSSVYAHEIYKKLGFIDTGLLCDAGGIKYYPMKYQKSFRENERKG
jgi:GNAT superfamily N-acetyltransferase